MFINSFGPLLIHASFAVIFTASVLILSNILGPRKYNPVKSDTYECGVHYYNDARGHIHIKFYLIAVLFILFDIEAIFLVPWAVAFRSFKGMGLGIFMFIEMAVFIAVLLLGYFYILKKGALKWE